MNSGTYTGIRDELCNGTAAGDVALYDWICPTIDIDEAVPVDMVRLAGDRYITREEFLRVQRRNMRRR